MKLKDLFETTQIPVVYNLKDFIHTAEMKPKINDRILFKGIEWHCRYRFDDDYKNGSGGSKWAGDGVFSAIDIKSRNNVIFYVKAPKAFGGNMIVDKKLFIQYILKINSLKKDVLISALLRDYKNSPETAAESKYSDSVIDLINYAREEGINYPEFNAIEKSIRAVK